MELIDKSVPVERTSPFGALFGVLYEPTATFTRLASRRSTWLPVAATCASMALMTLWYYLGFVDYAWLQEYNLNAIADQETRAMAKSADMGQQTMAIVSAIGVPVAMLASFAITALYLLIVGKFTNKEFSFGKGFSLAAWASVPVLLQLPLAAVQMLLAPDGRLPFEALNPTSLNQMLFHYEASHPMTGLLESISIPTVWSMLLMVIGYQVWAGVPRASAIRITLAPWVLIYGLWLAYAMSKTV